MLVDTTVQRWRILHLNLMAANEIGVPFPPPFKGVGQPFWECCAVPRVEETVMGVPRAGRQ